MTSLSRNLSLPGKIGYLVSFSIERKSSHERLPWAALPLHLAAVHFLEQVEKLPFGFSSIRLLSQVSSFGLMLYRSRLKRERAGGQGSRGAVAQVSTDATGVFGRSIQELAGPHWRLLELFSKQAFQLCWMHRKLTIWIDYISGFAWLIQSIV